VSPSAIRWPRSSVFRVAARDAEHLRDHVHRQRDRERLDEIVHRLRLDRLEALARDLPDHRLLQLRGARRERADHQLAVLVVLRRVHLEDRRRNPLRPIRVRHLVELNAARRREALRIARHRHDVGVLEHAPRAARSRIPGQRILAAQAPERGVRIAEEEGRVVGGEVVHAGHPQVVARTVGHTSTQPPSLV
jgi:hypothetical protein